MRTRWRLVIAVALALPVPLASTGEAGIREVLLFKSSRMYSVPSVTLDREGDPHMLYASEGDAIYHAWPEGSNWRWEVVEPRLAACGAHSIAVDSVGRIHVAYELVDFETGNTLVYGIRDAAGWTLSEVGSSRRGFPIAAIVIGPGDRPRVLHMGPAGNLVVEHLEGAAWRSEDTGLAGSDWAHGLEPFVLDGLGRSHVLFARDGYYHYATDASGTWVEEAISGYEIGDLVVTASGVPHVAVANAGTHPDDHILHLWNEGEGWQTEEILPSGDPFRNRIVGGLEVDDAGHLFVAFTEARYLRHRWELRPRLAHFDGLEWREDHTVGPASTEVLSTVRGADGTVHAACWRWRLTYLRFTVPDLRAEWEDLETRAVGAGLRVAGSVTVRNVGPGASRPARVAFYLSEDDLLDEADEPLGVVSKVGRVRPGKERSIPVSVVLPGAAEGKRLLAVIDPEGVRNDVDRPNNTAVAPIGD